MPYDQTNRERGLERDFRNCFLHEIMSSCGGIFLMAILIIHLSIRSKRITRKVNNRQKSSFNQVMPKKTSVSIHLPSFEDASSLNLSIRCPILWPALSTAFSFGVRLSFFSASA